MASEMTNDEPSGLTAIPLFRHLSSDAFEKISGLMVKHSYKSGDAIFLERERGDALTW